MKRVTIIGVAGSGKTTESFNFAISIAKKEDIGAIILTRKGREMIKERYEDIETTTAHSFALNKILKKFNEYDYDNDIIEDESKSAFFSANFKLKYLPRLKGFEIHRMPDGNKVNYIKTMLLNTFIRNISECKTNQVLNVIYKLKEEIGLEMNEKKIYDILIEYEDYLRKNNKTDYDYMILDAIEKAPLVDFDKKVLVWDEANDSMPLLAELIEKLASEEKFEYIIANGDSAQRIYPYPNGDTYFRRLYERSNEKILLPKTKRLPRIVVDNAVQKVFSKIPKVDRIVERIETEKEGGYVRKIDEALIPNVVKNLVSLNEKSAIIVLSNSIGLEVAKMLEFSGYPFTFVYENASLGWDAILLEVRNFLWYCKIQKFDGNFRYSYQIVKKYLPYEYYLNDFELTDIELVKRKFSNYVEILRVLDVGYDKKRLFKSLSINIEFVSIPEIITVHSAKGLEYDNVIAVLKPTRHMEENYSNIEVLNLYKKIIYTQLTRTKNRLFLAGELNSLII